ncbi:MAG: penicillin acylase family protein, partial [Candidatus Binatia bacterium]
GHELANAAFLTGLVDEFGATEGRRIYEDFRNRFNHDGPVHVDDTSFRYNTHASTDPTCPGDPGAIDPASTVLVYSSGKPGLQVTFESLPDDLGRLAPELAVLAARAAIRWDRLAFDSPLGRIDLRPRGMSNFLAISKAKAAGGHPILLGGPQAAYFSPEILNELEIHSPTIDTRGAAFPGISMFVLLGRGIRSAWTATAGGSDMVDTRIEKLCEVDGSTPTEHSYGYRFRGECLPMERRV